MRDDFGPSLLDMGNTKSVDDGFADFKSATANGDFNPRGDLTAGKSTIFIIITNKSLLDDVHSLVRCS